MRVELLINYFIMRKITLLMAFFAITVFTFGQMSRCPDLSKTNKLNKVSENALKGTKAVGDTIYYEDFGNGLPAGWISVDNTGNGFNWIYSTVGPTGAYTGTWPNPADAIGSPSAANGFMMLPMDFYNTDGTGVIVSNVVDMDVYLQTSVFDFTAETSVIITLASEFRTCCSGSAELWISISTDGTNWSNHYVANDGIPNNEWWYTEPQFNISDIVAGQSTVYFRFGVNDASHYFWEIDDILFMNGPANDILIEENYTFFYFSDWGYYNQIPFAQAIEDSIYWDCAILNNGSNTAYNCVLDIEITHDVQGSVFTGTSDPLTILPIARDTLELSNFGDGFSPQETGEYTMTYTISSDSIDEINENNVAERSFIVSDFVYARDNGIVEDFDEVSPQIWAGTAADGYKFGVMYQLVADVTEVHQMQIYVQNTSEEGATIIGRLIDYAGGDFIPILETDEVTISLDDTSTWKTLDFELDGQSELLGSGLYLVALECYFQGYDFYVGEDNTTEQDGWTTWWDDPSDPGFHWYSNYYQTPAIRMLIFDSLAVDSLVIDENAPPSVVADEEYSYTPTATGGSGDYTWSFPTLPSWLSWDAGTGILSGTPTLSDTLDTDVVVQVEDDSLVTDTYAFTISIINSINEFENNISIYPNPTNGLLNINNVQGASIKVHNIVGELVASIEKADAFNTIDMTNLAQGTYLVKIIYKDQVITKKINLEE